MDQHSHQNRDGRPGSALGPDSVRPRERPWQVLLVGAACAAMIAGIGAWIYNWSIGTGAFEPAPDLAEPKAFEREGLALKYPGNWQLKVGEDAPDGDFYIGPKRADAGISLRLHAEPVQAQACVEQTASTLSGTGDMAAIDRWGTFAGAGYRGSLTVDDRAYQLLIFCSTEDLRPFEVMLVIEDGVFDKLTPGFDLIRDSLKRTIEGEA